MTGREQLIRLLSRVLVGFALVSLGVVWGKAMMRRQLAALPVISAPPVSPAQPVISAARSVQVYYVHTTLRCVTCNAIERQANDALKTRFGDELASGTVQWHSKNFQRDDVFARRYGISSSCVLVVARDGDQEAGFKRLDDVWTLVEEPAKFETYVVDAVRAWLPAEKASAN
jgi:hypothetical protein